MDYVKLYEEFILSQAQLQAQVQSDVELSDKTIDDVLSDDFFEEEGFEIDQNGVYHIKNWMVY
jgi:hypothetical protein